MSAFDVPSEDKNQLRLNALSIDGQSGIQTLLDNLNRPINMSINTIEYLPAQPSVVVTETLPGIVVTVIPEPIIRPYSSLGSATNNVVTKVNNLTDKQFRSIIIGLLSLGIILMAISVISK